MDLVFIEELEEDKIMEQQFVEAHATQTYTREENVIKVEVQPSIEVQALIEAQLKAMEIKMYESVVAVKRRCVIMDKATLLDKCICIANPGRFMWIQTK